jgi:hypothetical protein
MKWTEWETDTCKDVAEFSFHSRKKFLDHMHEYELLH